MPGWYIHLDVARKTLDDLPKNPLAQQLFQNSGVDPSDLRDLARNNPAYFALGAIGPDIFFFLPDFTPPAGNVVFAAADTIRRLYQDFDQQFLGPWEDSVLPAVMNASDLASALTGGLFKQISEIFSEGVRIIKDAFIVAAIRQYDIFGLLGSGVPKGQDEQSFFWSDMLHYRKTYQFATHLWQTATAAASVTKSSVLRKRAEQHQAFALGWMTHLATDVVGHSFVNEKVGGPYRLHWQRHHLVENHMDALVYDTEYRGDEIYQQLSCSALHLWIGFDDNGVSLLSLFDRLPGYAYPAQVDPPSDSIPGAAYGTDRDDTPDVLSRRRAWDFDAQMPDHLANFLAKALKQVYDPVANPSLVGPKGQWTSHPTILAEIGGPFDGFPDKDLISATYWWLFGYLKNVTTDYFKILRPEPPEVDDFPPSPSPQGAGVHDPSFKGGAPGGGPPQSLDQLLNELGAAFERFEKWIWDEGAFIAAITGRATYPLREWLYDNLEVPLYNAWAALHWYLAATGFVLPTAEEIQPGLTTLGASTSINMPKLAAELNDISGGMLSRIGVNPPIDAPSDEPSGRGRDETAPHDIVADPPQLLEATVKQVFNSMFGVPTGCTATPGGEVPSEFLRPWTWPALDNAADPVPTEFPMVKLAGPYETGRDAMALLGTLSGDQQARADFEGAQRPSDTIVFALDHLPKGEHLGDPVDYGAYVIAQLTAPGLTPKEVSNFNLDSDRGYAFLCWDWVRTHDAKLLAAPNANPNIRPYQPPLRPGAGWCFDDIVDKQRHPLVPPPPDWPAMHDPRQASPEPVQIRYLDREPK